MTSGEAAAGRRLSRLAVVVIGWTVLTGVSVVAWLARPSPTHRVATTSASAAGSSTLPAAHASSASGSNAAIGDEGALAKGLGPGESRPNGALVARDLLPGQSTPHVLAAGGRQNDPAPTGPDSGPGTFDARSLVICPDDHGGDYGYLTTTLATIGIAHDVLLSTSVDLSPAMLATSSGHGRYQAVFLCSSDLIRVVPPGETGAGEFRPTFTADEWATLHDYERRFGVRQVVAFASPAPSDPDPSGLVTVGSSDTSTTPIDATLTDAGRAAFRYLQPSAVLPIHNSYVVLTEPAPGASVTPLVVDAAGHPLVASATVDGREILSVTFANNEEFIASAALAYGLIDWATRGTFVGSREVTLSVQIDDLLIQNSTWDPQASSDTSGKTVRMTGDDLRAVAAWQRDKQATPLTAALRLEWAFVGAGATGLYPDDSLTPAVKELQGEFSWVNHTVHHPSLDAPMTAAAVTKELTDNDRIGRDVLGLTHYSSDAMVQPAITGLENPDFYTGAAAAGIRYAISDTSRSLWRSPTPNAGYDALLASILVVPRGTTDLYYNVATPDEWLSEYRKSYPKATGSGSGGALTYDDVVSANADAIVDRMIRFDLSPWMFHQPNTVVYGSAAGERPTLLTHLLDVALARYSALFALPVRSLPESEIGRRMQQRMDYEASDVTATITPCESITVRAGTRAVPVPLTGALASGSTSYGGDDVSTVELAPGESRSFAVAACA